MENFNVKDYWENRYVNGGDSGWGSHNQTIVNFKKDYINNIIQRFSIKTIVDLGCGDGNQLGYLNGYEKYYGYDISHNVLTKCKIMYLNQNNKEFVNNVEELLVRKYDLALSLDVIYHLVEDDMYYEHIKNLFLLSDLICIFSTDDDVKDNETPLPHLRNRKISKYVEENFSNFKLIESKRFYEISENNIGFFIYKIMENNNEQ